MPMRYFSVHYAAYAKRTLRNIAESKRRGHSWGQTWVEIRTGSGSFRQQERGPFVNTSDDDRQADERHHARLVLDKFAPGPTVKTSPP